MLFWYSGGPGFGPLQGTKRRRGFTNLEPLFSAQAETDKKEFRVIKDYTGVRGQLGLCKTLSLKNKK